MASPSAAKTKTLGDLLRQGREAKGMTQEGLGAVLGMRQPAVCGWERNRARPNARTLADLAELLDLDLAELTLAAGNPIEYPRGAAPPE